VAFPIAPGRGALTATEKRATPPKETEGTRMSDHLPFVMTLAVQTPLDQAAGSTGSAAGAAPTTGGAVTGAPGGTTGTTGTPAGPQQPRGGDSTFLFMIVGLLAIMIVMTMVTSRRQKKQRESMLGALRKHDRVVTTGGIIGSVVEIKPRWIVLKVDEGSNTRITFSREAIQQVLEESPEPSASAGGEAKS